MSCQMDSVSDMHQLRNTVMAAVVSFAKTDRLHPKTVAVVLANLSAVVAKAAGSAAIEWVEGNSVVMNNVWGQQPPDDGGNQHEKFHGQAEWRIVEKI